jgi:hypothetical protein
VICVQTNEDKAKHTLPTIRRIPDELWDVFKKILPREKPPKTVGRPIIPYRKILDGILYILRLLKNYDDKIGLNWTWQSIDSISIKSPLGGPRLEIIPLLIGAN